MPVMDLIFGTYYEPKEMPEKYGISERVSHNYFAQIVSPLIPDRFKRRRSPKRPAVDVSAPTDTVDRS
jgi:hypothetical protein